MIRTILAMLLILCGASSVEAQIVGQGSPATTSDADSWPIKIVFGDAQIDPRRVWDGVDFVNVSGTGSLQVTCDNCGGASPFEDNDAFTFNTSSVMNIGAVVDDTATNTVTENSAGAPRMSTNRVLYAAPFTSGGTALFPDPAALTDNTANPSLTQIGVMPFVFDGATWDRMTQPLTDTQLRATPVPIDSGVRITDTPDASDNFFPVVGVNATGTNYGIANVLNVAPDAGASGWVTRQVGMPDPAALTDNTANPTLTKLQTFQMVWDGATWDRTPGNSSDGALVNLGANNDVVVSGTVTVTDGAGALNVIVDSGSITAIGAAADGAAVSGNPVRIAGKDGSGNTQDIITDTSGELQVDVLTLPSVTIGTFPDNEPFNLNQIAGNGVSTGVGASGTGTQRVAALLHDGTDTALINGSGELLTSTAVTSFPDNEPFNVAQFGGSAVVTGTGASGAGIPRVTVANDSSIIVGTFPDNEPFNVAQYGGVAVSTTNPFHTKEIRAATPATTNVSDTASNVTCLASNANRLGAVIVNDSTSTLYIKFGATASTTSFTFKVYTDGTVTVPFGYTGIIDCIWSADSTGAARVTEVTQ